MYTSDIDLTDTYYIVVCLVTLDCTGGVIPL